MFGQLAYEAYAVSAGHKSLATGVPLPHWDELRKEIKDAWESSGEAVVRAVRAAEERTS